jgi:hypothetical protein
MGCRWDDTDCVASRKESKGRDPSPDVAAEKSGHSRDNRRLRPIDFMPFLTHL